MTVPAGAKTGAISVTSGGGTAASPPFAVVLAVNGDLKTFLMALPIPLENSNAFISPPQADLDTWRNISTLAMMGTLPKIGEAAGLASKQGYTGIIFTHTDNHQYFILYENTGSSFRGQGTFVFDMQYERNMLIGSPHPIFDSTLAESIDVLLAVHPRAFITAGTHRCATCGTASSFLGTTDVCNTFCSLSAGNNPYRISDVAHHNANFYHQTHEVFIDNIPGLNVLSLHGASDAGLGLDGGGSQIHMILSHGVTESYPGTFSIHQLDTTIGTQAPTLNVGIYPDDTAALGGISNLQGLYVNSRNISAYCFPPLCSANGQFMHLEQGLTVINSPQPLIAGLKTVFPN